MKVLSLRQLAVEAVYQEIISKFDFFFQQNDELRNSNLSDAAHEGECQGQLHDDSSDDDDCSLSLEERDEALKELREKMDHYLIGLFSKERHQFVD